MTMNPSPTVKEYVKAICKVAGIKRYVPSLPYKVVLIASYLISILSKPFGLKHPFSPVRVSKMVRSNNIKPLYLKKNEYKYLYELEDAFEDWKKKSPEEWE